MAIAPSEKTAVLLVNLGSPEKLSIKAIRQYLKEFLSDARIISIPAIWRWLLLRLIILPFRPSKVYRNYRKIWQFGQSPLIFYTKRLKTKLQAKLKNKATVLIAMRYAKPALAPALNTCLKNGITRLVVVPLFPQYASATVASVYERIFAILSRKQQLPAVTMVPPYYGHPAFAEAILESAKGYLKNDYDYFLFSYHGIPVSQLLAGETAKDHCRMNLTCCMATTAENRFCYRSQCIKTTVLLADKLKLDKKKCLSVFQSRFGPSEWIKPALDDSLSELAKKGARVLVLCPGFAADCLETLEEVAIAGKKDFLAQGGKKFDMVPCLNDNDYWAKSLADILKPYIN